MGIKIELASYVKELQSVVTDVGVKLAKFGGHLETMNTRLESGVRRFDGYDTDLKDMNTEISVVKKEISDEITCIKKEMSNEITCIKKDMTHLIINQRIFMWIFGGVGAIVIVVVSSWVENFISKVA